MTNKIVQALEILGVSKRARQVFDQLYQNHQLSITEISKLTGFHRAQIYEVIQELLDEDLATESDKTKTKIVVVMPHVILTRVQSLESKVQKTVTGFIDDFDILLSKYNQIETSTVLKIKKGTNQVIRQFVEAYKNIHQEVLFIGNEKSYIELLGIDVLNAFSDYRHDQNIPMRVLATEDKINFKDNQINRKVQKLDNFKLPFALQVIDNKVFFWDTEQERVIIVDDVNLGLFWRAIFDIMWNE